MNMKKRGRRFPGTPHEMFASIVRAEREQQNLLIDEAVAVLRVDDSATFGDIVIRLSNGWGLPGVICLCVRLLDEITAVHRTVIERATGQDNPWDSRRLLSRRDVLTPPDDVLKEVKQLAQYWPDRKFEPCVAIFMAAMETPTILRDLTADLCAWYSDYYQQAQTLLRIADAIFPPGKERPSP